MIEDTIIKELVNEKLPCFQFNVIPKVESEFKVTNFKLKKGVTAEHCHFIVAHDRDLLTKTGNEWSRAHFQELDEKFDQILISKVDRVEKGNFRLVQHFNHEQQQWLRIRRKEDYAIRKSRVPLAISIKLKPTYPYFDFLLSYHKLAFL